MAKEKISTAKAPEAIGPYSQGVASGGLLFLSGQIPIDPATGEVERGGIEAEARRVLTNLKAVLEAAGSGLDDVVKTTVYLTDLAGFADVNRVYGEFFAEPYPARATVEVGGLPRGVGVEMDLVAVVGGKG
ncbi:MAG: RidA family protein [Thermodesulfobacteriota bacterium]